MQAAPPVRIRVDARGAAACAAILVAVAAAGCSAWAVGLAQWPGAGWIAVSAGAATGMLAWRRLPRDGGFLAWDGRVWRWADAAGSVRVMIDVDVCMLLAFSPALGGRTRWLTVGPAVPEAAWHGLRAAVYSRASTPHAE